MTPQPNDTTDVCLTEPAASNTDLTHDQQQPNHKGPRRHSVADWADHNRKQTQKPTMALVSDTRRINRGTGGVEIVSNHDYEHRRRLRQRTTANALSG